MAADSRNDFNAAVRECLANCYRTDLPVAALAEYVEVLKQRDWTPAEIHRVEAAVLKILLAVVSKDERYDLINRMAKPREDRSVPTGQRDNDKIRERRRATPKSARECAPEEGSADAGGGTAEAKHRPRSVRQGP